MMTTKKWIFIIRHLALLLGRKFKSQVCLAHPCRGLLTFLASLLFADVFAQLRRKRRFWSAPRGHGVWEQQFLTTFCLVGLQFPDWEDHQYLKHLRLTKDALFSNAYAIQALLMKGDTRFRLAVPSEKRLPMTSRFSSWFTLS